MGGGITRTFGPWTNTSDDSYIYQLSLVVATASASFERSEFLIATSPKKSLRVCYSTNLGFSEVRIKYQIRMYLASAGRNEVGYRKVA